MNIVSTMVGLSIMGAAAPSMMTMSIAPFEAQKRAQNLGVAETSAVVFAATYEGGLEIPENNDVCTYKAREGTDNAYSVTCTHGSGKFVQSVTRAFRLAVPDKGLDDAGGSDTIREFAYQTPTRFSGHSCPYYDEWGTNGYNDDNYERMNGACIPIPVWTQTAYQFSTPDAWLYDVNNYNGWGHHPDYDNS
jgi:hypothetical protein